jgi:phosphate transport system permease protein
MLFISIIGNGYTAFWQTFIQLEVQLDASLIDPDGTRDPAVIAGANYGGLIKKSLREMFPEVSGRRDKRKLYGIVSSGASYILQDYVIANPASIGSTIQLWVPADDDVDMLMKGHFDRDKPEAERRIKDKQIAWVDRLVAEDRVESHFNRTFFTAGDSREPELAGIRGAASGSFFTLIVTLLLAFPLGVATAVYLEEFAPQNRWTDLIEVNINNLAAVPSIVFGLLGLAVFINFFGLPRSAPLVGGLVLTLMTLPTIIIASRAALKSVPPSIREAALGVGASKMQMVFHHVLPLAMPGMLTGTIIGMAQALGESAPLLMIGMVAFIVDVPDSVMDPSTVLPVQIYLWADSPERAFVERTSAAIMVLLSFLIAMNALAVLLRRKFERRW